MPWKIVSDSGKYCVVKKSNGKVVKCHSNRDDAVNHLQALYASESKETEFSQVLVRKEGDSYWITSVSTAAVKDMEGETFTTDAIDYDIAVSKETGMYPEFRVFHRKSLAIGKVQKMSRVGIFAVDEGPSYTDPFSLAVCEKMLGNNDGRWRTSRGFYVLEASGRCPSCDSVLLLAAKQLTRGYFCPVCMSRHVGYKGVLKEVHFRKARTFDITITDVPAVLYTGVSARKIPQPIMEDVSMSKKELRDKLIDAGIDPEVVDTRIGELSDAELKEWSDFPLATVLKEFESDEGDDEGDDTFVLDESVLKEFAEIQKRELHAQLEPLLMNLLDGLSLEIPEFPEMKELSEIAEMKTQIGELADAVTELKEAVIALSDKDEVRLKEMLDGMGRRSKLRVVRFKSDDKEEEDEEEDDKLPGHPSEAKERDVKIVSADGQEYSSMTGFIQGRND